MDIDYLLLSSYCFLYSFLSYIELCKIISSSDLQNNKKIVISHFCLLVDGDMIPYLVSGGVFFFLLWHFPIGSFELTITVLQHFVFLGFCDVIITFSDVIIGFDAI